jgi:hypothetical protein
MKNFLLLALILSLSGKNAHGQEVSGDLDQDLYDHLPLEKYGNTSKNDLREIINQSQDKIKEIEQLQATPLVKLYAAIWNLYSNKNLEALMKVCNQETNHLQDASSLRVALYAKNYIAVDLLLKAGANVHAQLPGEYASVLQVAVYSGDSRLVKKILDAEAQSNSVEESAIKNIENKDEQAKIRELLAAGTTRF